MIDRLYGRATQDYEAQETHTQKIEIRDDEVVVDQQYHEVSELPFESQDVELVRSKFNLPTDGFEFDLAMEALAFNRKEQSKDD